MKQGGVSFISKASLTKKQIIVIVASVLAAVLCIAGIILACVRVSLTEKIKFVQ